LDCNYHFPIDLAPIEIPIGAVSYWSHDAERRQSLGQLYVWSLLFSPVCGNCWRLITQRNLFEILLNQTEIRLYSPFSDWFGTKRISVWFQINRKIVNTIWFQFDLTRFGKDFSVCSFTPNNKVPHVTLKASDETGSRKLNSIKMDWRCNLSPDCKTYGFF